MPLESASILKIALPLSGALTGRPQVLLHPSTPKAHPHPAQAPSRSRPGLLASPTPETLEQH